VLVLDDGLQHYRCGAISRLRWSTAAASATAFCCRAGPLREPAWRLQSVDAVVSHDSSVRGYSMQLEGEVLHRMTDAATAAPRAPSPARKSTPSPASAIRTASSRTWRSSPQGAAASLCGSSCVLAARPRVRRRPAGADDRKDAVKLRHAARPEWWVLPVSAKLDPAFGTGC